MAATGWFARDEVYVGRDVPGRALEITPQMVQTFVEGTGDDHPWYRGRSPRGGPLAPATLLYSEVFRDRSWYLPNLYGNLHARQQWESFAPVMVGERVTTRCTVVDRYLRRGRDYVVGELMVLDGDGRLAWRGRTHQSFLIDAEPQGMAVDKTREKATGREFAFPQHDGESVSGSVRRVDEAMCRAFSGPERNYHNDRSKALELGFPEIVVQGMLSVCLVAEMMTRRFGLGFLCSGRMDLKLVNVLWVNEVTSTHGVIFERHAEGRRRRAELEVWCQKADGTKTVVGTASALEGGD